MSDQDTNQPHGGRLKFDPTINAGHLLTFAGFIVAGFVGWTTLDKRVVILEQQRISQEYRDNSQDSRNDEFKSEIKDTLKDIKNTLEIVRSQVVRK
jgi:hypothetical protein